MKTNSLIVVALIALAGAISAADSPIDKGSMLIDGSLYFQSYSGDIWEDSDGNGISISGVGSSQTREGIAVEASPVFGYFLAKGVCVGVQFGLEHISFGDEDKLDILAFGPNLAYYAKINPSVAEIKGSLYAYSRGYLTFGSAKDEDDHGPSITQYGGDFGLLYMVSQAVGADISFKIQGDSWKREDFNGDERTEKGMTIRIGVGMTAFIL